MQVHTNKPKARFFAEKCDVFASARNFARLAFDGVQEILLVRDPRDIHCSRRAFWSDTAESSLQNLRTVQAAVLPILQQDRNDLLVVRYEDLVQQPQDTLSQIAAYLGLDHGIELNPESEGEIFAAHGTSKDPASSIGRWRDELDAVELATLDHSLNPFLTAFGYETGA